MNNAAGFINGNQTLGTKSYHYNEILFKISKHSNWINPWKY